MKIQNWAIIFIIIIVPISLVITQYIQTQIDTISLQTTYDSKLQTATSDAISSFQLNTINNKYSTVSDSKIRDIEASVSTFYNSLGTELGASGYSAQELQGYIPAILYTMYDGYYIHSKYFNETANEYQYGLKPYIYYSCRYISGSDDFVINYTLDNNITIYGKVDGEYVTKTGALIDSSLITFDEATDMKQYTYMDSLGNIYTKKYPTKIIYDEVTIEPEILKEQLITLNNSNQPTNGEYEYIIYKNRKVYRDEAGYFWNTNNKKQYITDEATLYYMQNIAYYDGHLHSFSDVQYYYDALEFSKWVNEKLRNITQKNAFEADGKTQITDFAINTGDEKIFVLNRNNNPLLSNSTFDENRRSVIRRTITSNLAAAIANFSSGVGYEFILPNFTEQDWDKIENNITVATFMQGIPIGSKYYNNYSVITNNKNKEFVSKNSIYIITEDNEVHLPSCKDIVSGSGITAVSAYSNIGFERQSVTVSDGNEVYFYPHSNEKNYGCLVGTARTYDIDNIIEGTVYSYNRFADTYTPDNNATRKLANTNLRKVYLSSLAREKYDLYKTNAYFSSDDELTSGSVSTINVSGNYMYWKNTPATIEITRQSGLNIQYRNGNTGDWTTVPKGQSVTITVSGNTTVYYRYTADNGGANTSDAETVVINRIDKTSPIIEPTIHTTSQNTNSFTVSLGAHDPESGIAKVIWYYRVAGDDGEYKTIVSDYATINGTIAGFSDITAEKTIGNLTTGKYEVYADVYNVAGSSTTTGPIQVTINDTTLGESLNNSTTAIVFPTTWTNQNVAVILPQRAEYTTLYATRNEIPNQEYTKTLSVEENTIINYVFSDGINMLNTTFKSVTIGNIDKVLPSITEGLQVTSVETKSFGLKIGVQDLDSGLSKIVWYYKNKLEANYSEETTNIDTPDNNINGTGKHNTTAEITIGNLTSGTYQVYAEIYDVAGNIISTIDGNGSPIQIDISKVPETGEGDAIANPTTWTNKNVTVTINGKDGFVTQYKTNTTNNTEWQTYTGNVTMEKNGMVYYRFSDGINASGYGTVNISNIDKNSPKVTSGLTISNITTNSFVASTTALDSESGLDKIVWKFKMNGSNNETTITDDYQTGITTEATQTRQFTNLISGSYIISAEIYDLAGNITKTSTRDLVIQAIGRVFTGTINPTYWTNQDVTVILPVSAGRTTQYLLNSSNSTWKNYSSQFKIGSNDVINYRYTDGTNTTNYASITVSNIDRVKPTITEQIKTKSIGTSRIGVTITTQDFDSGIAKIVWHYKKSTDANWIQITDSYAEINSNIKGLTTKNTYSKIFYKLTTGNYDIYCEIYDVAGNVVTSNTLSNIRTKDIPPITDTGLKVEPATWTNQNVKVTLPTSSDIKTRYQIDSASGEWTDFYDQTKVTAATNCVVYYKFEDDANHTNYKSVTITNIDKLPPTDTAPTAETTSHSITITNHQTDQEATAKYGKSGIATIEYSIDAGNTWQTSNEFEGVAPNTTYTIATKNTDVAGNVKISKTTDVKTKKIKAEEVSYTPTNSNWKVTNVKEALDFLYNN